MILPWVGLLVSLFLATGPLYICLPKSMASTSHSSSCCQSSLALSCHGLRLRYRRVLRPLMLAGTVGSPQTERKTGGAQPGPAGSPGNHSMPLLLLLQVPEDSASSPGAPSPAPCCPRARTPVHPEPQFPAACPQQAPRSTSLVSLQTPPAPRATVACGDLILTHHHGPQGAPARVECS